MSAKPGEPIPEGGARERWLVWSNKHRAWWAPNKCGYRQDVNQAGRYTLEDAIRCCEARSRDVIPPEVLVPSPEYVAMLRAAPPQGETPPPEHVFVACWCDPMCCDIGKEGCHADKGSDYCRLPRNMHAAPPPERGRAERTPEDWDCGCGLGRCCPATPAEPPEGQAAGRLREIQTSLSCLAAIMETPKDAAAVESLYASLVNWPGWEAIPPPATTEPLPMVLHCPRCGKRHIDEPQPEKGWDNPPHRSHECQGCGTVWRPADVPTTGVASIATRGARDSWQPEPPATTEPPGCPHHRPYPAECPHCKAAFIAGIDAAVAPPSSQGIGATTEEGGGSRRSLPAGATPRKGGLMERGAGRVPCLPPTCHDCGFEWKELYERAQVTIRELKEGIHTVNVRGGLGADVHNMLDKLEKL